MSARVSIFLLIAIVSGACASTSMLGIDTTVSIAPGLTPRMTPDAVADIVVARIHENEVNVGKVLIPPKILRITATTGSHVGGIEPGAGLTHRAEPGILWVVRAEGTFTTAHGLSAVDPVESTGYFVIADADGSVIGFGFP